MDTKHEKNIESALRNGLWSLVFRGGAMSMPKLDIQMSPHPTLFTISLEPSCSIPHVPMRVEKIIFRHVQIDLA